jgi:16S rRNA (cytidine1402-2'-O)-methyltransferase
VARPSPRPSNYKQIQTLSIDSEDPLKAGRLYVVATPLGHRDDLSSRALQVLRDVRLIACEDTRRTAPLLRSHGIQTPLTSYFEHNEDWKGARLIEALQSGTDVALVSDAGTPGISDPGFRLVRDARQAGLEVLPVPGPSAVTAALSVSGLPTDRFLFVGFLPRRRGARDEALRELAERTETVVFYESPLRILSTLEAVQAAFGEREAFLCREATKLHEEYRLSTLSGLREALAGRPVKGEIVLVVRGRGEPAPRPEQDADALLARLIAEGKTKSEAAREVARLTGLPRREVYKRTL